MWWDGVDCQLTRYYFLFDFIFSSLLYFSSFLLNGRWFVLLIVSHSAKKEFYLISYSVNPHHAMVLPEMIQKFVLKEANGPRESREDPRLITIPPDWNSTTFAIFMKCGAFNANEYVKAIEDDVKSKRRIKIA